MSIKRILRKTRYGWFGFLSVLAGLLVAVGLPVISEAAESKTLTIAQAGDVAIIDDMVASRASRVATTHIYDFGWTHCNLSPNPGGIVTEVFGDTRPGVIWAIKAFPQPDGTTIQRFHVRPGAKHHSGNPVVAEDFKYAILRRAGLNRNKIDISFGAMYPEKGGRYTLDESVTIIDDYTFDVRVEKNLPLFSNIWQMRNYYDSKLMKANATPDDPWSRKFAAKNDAGNGPYMLEKWVEGSEMVFKRYEDYWGPRPPIDRLLFRTIPDLSARVMLLKRGDVDVALQVPLQELRSLKKAPGVKVISTPSFNQLYIIMNPNIKPFDNRDLRMALTHAFPYDEVINAVYQDGAQPLYGSIATGMRGALKERRFKTDLDLAKQYLEKAGYKDGLTLTMKWEAIMPEHKQVGILFMENLRQIGVELKLQQLPRGQYQKGKRDHTLDFYPCEYMGWFKSPEYIHLMHFYSTSHSNYAEWKNEVADKLIIEASQELDPDKRAELSERVQEIIMQDPPWIFVCQPDFQLAMRSDIVGYVSTFTEYPAFWWMHKK